jgi:excisionase family DNA binding protein
MQFGNLKVYTTKEAAKEMNIHIEVLRRLLRNGQLKGTKRQNKWFIPEQYIHEYYIGDHTDEAGNEEKTD